MTLHRHRYLDHSTGFTLVELMVAMTIGMILVLAAVTIYGQGRSTFRTVETIARIQENARFAMDVMGPDIRLAGHWGRNNQAAYIEVPGAINVACGGLDISAWALDLGSKIEATDDQYSLPCAAFSGVQPNTDVLIVRHGRGTATAPTAGTIQVQSNRSVGALFNDGVVPQLLESATNSTTHDLVVNAYYVDQTSSLGDVPSLRRYRLVGGVLQDEEIIPGVESFQVQLGVDTDSDGNVNRYVDSNSGVVTPGAAAFVPGSNVVAVRLWLLVRAERPENLYNDAGPYNPPDADLTAITPNDGFRRMQMSKTVFLRNSRG